MVDSWEGRDFGYDQVGITDPYYDIHRTRFSFDPDDVLNINAPVQHHSHKRPYEQESINNRCQELLINLRNIEDERNKYKARLQEIERRKEVERKEAERKKESFYSPHTNSPWAGILGSDSEFTMILIFITVVFLILQLQIQEMNRLLHELIRAK